MNTAKVLIPNKEWLVVDSNQKIGGLTKHKKGYIFHKNGKELGFKTLNEVKSQLGIELFEERLKKISAQTTEYSVHDFPCRTQPFNPVYNVKNRLPLYTKNLKSKSRYCAGYYVIKFLSKTNYS